MSDDHDPKIAILVPAHRALRRAFVGWQCRSRQMSVRRAGGRPDAAMRPRVLVPPADADAGRIVVLIRKNDSPDVTQRLRHLVRRTQDPADRRASALEFLASAYYQQPDTFSDEMTALFAPASRLADDLLQATRCTLAFEHPAESYRLAVRIAELAPADEAFQFTFWHNSLFNPALPGDVRVLALRPDWSRSTRA